MDDPIFKSSLESYQYQNQIAVGQKFRQWWTLLQIILPSLTQNKHLWRFQTLLPWYMIYLDCVMSKNHDLLQNKSLRNRLIIAASVMEFISTTPKNELFEKILLQNQPKTTNFINWWTYKYQFPVFSSVFQSKCSFGFPVTAFIKKYAFVHHWRRPCPSLTREIDDKK